MYYEEFENREWNLYAPSHGLLTVTKQLIFLFPFHCFSVITLFDLNKESF